MRQARDQTNRRGVGISPRRVGFQHIAEIKETTRQGGTVHGRQGLGADAQNCKTCRQHEAFLATCHGNIDPPCVKLKRHRRNGRHAIDKQHRIMTCGIKGRAYPRNIGAHPCRGFVMGGKNDFDLTLNIRTQCRLNLRNRGRLPPWHINDLDVQTVALAHINPAMAEHAKPRGKNSVTRTQCVGDGRLPPACACRGQQDHFALGHLQHAAHPRHGRLEHRAKGGTAVIKRGHITGFANALWDIGWPRNENWILKRHFVRPSLQRLDVD